MNVLSLFDGMSCGQIALNRLGIEYNNYFASEIDKHAINVTQHNFPNTIQLGSVVDVDTSKLPNIDIMFGGSPCQSFSFQGKRKGMSTKDEIEILTLGQYLDLKEKGFEFEGQSYLFWEYVRILNEVKPKYFMLENVKMAKKWEDIISDTLGVKPIFINSRLISAQNRPRLYWTNIPGIEQPEDKNLTFKDVEQELETDSYWKDYQMEKFRKGEYIRKDYYKIIDSNSKIGCLQAQMGMNKPKTGDVNGNFRVLNILEWERLQTVPDNYTNVDGVPKTQRYKMLGNGWTVDVIAHIFKNMEL